MVVKWAKDEKKERKREKDVRISPRFWFAALEYQMGEATLEIGQTASEPAIQANRRHPK